MVNATEMAKPFGKEAKHWLNLQATNEFIKELSAVRKILSTELVQVVNGNNGDTSTMKKGLRIY